MKSYKAEAIVLGERNLGEADKILTLFSQHEGKLRVVAKGIRRVKSRKAGSLADFRRVRLVLAKGRSLDIITEVELLNQRRGWRGDLVRVGLAYYLTEIVDRLTAERQSHPGVYLGLAEALDQLDQPRPGQLVRPFEELVLTELGFGVPERMKENKASLVNFIEEVAERSIKSSQVLRKLKNDRIITGKN